MAMTNKPSTFVYEQLGPYPDSIRFVTVDPCSSRSDQIECTLHDFRISANEGYTALSYVWGFPSRDPRMILLNGVQFPVQSNLWSFLFHARATLPGRYIWIDAICIDQAHTKERNRQVKIMGQIYSNASRVLAWLGAEDLRLRSLFADAGCWQSFFKIEQRPIRSRRHVLDRQKNHYLRRSLPATISYLSWIPPRLVHLLLSPYWQRTWIVQEILLAERLSFVCGDHMLDYDVLMQLFAHSDQRSSTSGLDEQAAIAEFSIWFDNDVVQRSISRDTNHLPPSLRLLLQRNDPHQIYRNLRIERMIVTMSDTKCSDPRDHIFGLLSLVHKGVTFSIDYNQSAEVLALHVLQHFGGNLGFFEMAIRCLDVEIERVYDVALRIVDDPGAHPDICPIIVFEVSHGCHCDVQSSRHIGNNESFMEHYSHGINCQNQCTQPPYWPRGKPVPWHTAAEDRHAYHPVLCLECIGTGSLWLMSSDVSYSTTDPEKLVIEDLFVIERRKTTFVAGHRESLGTTESACRFKGYLAFSRPENGVVRYHMTIDTFVSLILAQRSSFPWQPEAEWEVRNNRLGAEVTTANTTFIGRFSGGPPAQESGFPVTTI